MEEAHVTDKDQTVKDEISVEDEAHVAKQDQTKDESKAIALNSEMEGQPVSKPTENDIFRAFMEGASLQKLQDKVDSLEQKVATLEKSRGRERRSNSSRSSSPSSRASSEDSVHTNISSPQPTSDGAIQAKLRYAWWEDFQKIVPQQDRSLTPIVVLVGEPEPNEDATTLQTAELRPGPGVKSGRDPLPERIRIYSEEILKAMQQIDDSPGFKTSHRVKKRGLIMLRPYPWLNYFEQPLRSSVAKLEEEHKAQARTSDDRLETDDQSRPPEALVHLRCLIDFIDVHIRPKREYIASSECLEVYFHELWYLYRVGEEVLSFEGRQALRITNTLLPPHFSFKSGSEWLEMPRGPEIVSEKYKFTVVCTKICYGGRLLHGMDDNHSIVAFSGKRHIRSFFFYPLRLSSEENIRNRLIERGHKFQDVAITAKPMYYSGFTLTDADWGETPWTTTGDHVDGPVVIDFDEALSHNDGWKAVAPGTTDFGKKKTVTKCNSFCCKDEQIHNDATVSCKYVKDFRDSQITETETGTGKKPSLLVLGREPKELKTMGGDYEASDDEYVIMDSRVFGFVLRSRRWAQLSLDDLTYENKAQNETDRNAFDRLVLPDGHKEVVKALVTQHFRNKEASDKSKEQSDLIRGKGKGVIMLLHGAPGVGKTTTAEGIAEAFKKPLFQITCGDIGTTARDVEEELERNFSLASKWGCIMLLDEADVFLAQRERKDFVRNGLVSVFLRVLEYYTGVLFLTTNRIGDFDEAFSSRIHMSLFYPELDWEKTKRVFELNLELIENRYISKGRKLTFDKSSILNFAENHFKEHNRFGRWNGRQIRNACQTALALAEFEAMDEQTSLEVKTVDSVFLKLKHLQTVQKAYLDFAKYLGDVYGTEGDRRAPENRLRASEDEATDAPGRIAQRVAEKHQQQQQQHYPQLQQQNAGWHVPQGQREDQPWHAGGYMPSQPSYYYVSQTAPRAGYGPVADHPGGPVADHAAAATLTRDQKQPGRSGWSEAEAAPRAGQSGFTHAPVGGYEQRGVAKGWSRLYFDEIDKTKAVRRGDEK
ncbi:hypothetical protein L249_8674 [Ophiocordyceps polyrhachis-furcata BCC 54312]|uniref:AAA+ ATPase domain-containing protein n=1 Tax=Ophiocordyceps polyrhachis-furcata BCC 54312 TaxID=1330021 RepID=A0A367L6D3_9HYPO|nr:hypothetical protein L249_8674 [Ophiocordyceps polyrhachis-furcata BCC 54312]